jgi:hypothetical protein
LCSAIAMHINADIATVLSGNFIQTPKAISAVTVNAIIIPFIV